MPPVFMASERLGANARNHHPGSRTPMADRRNIRFTALGRMVANSVKAPLGAEAADCCCGRSCRYWHVTLGSEWGAARRALPKKIHRAQALLSNGPLHGQVLGHFPTTFPWPPAERDSGE